MFVGKINENHQTKWGIFSAIHVDRRVAIEMTLLNR